MIAISITVAKRAAPWVRLLLCAVVLHVVLPLKMAISSESLDGMRIVEGDIVVEPWQQRGFGLTQGTRVWPNGLVPYYVDQTLDPAVVANIEIAVNAWNRVAGITLLPVDDNSLPADYLDFQPGSGCASWVGFRGGAQEVWLSSDCSAGSIMHEIGHALGLEHEHTRSDRDQYLEILWGNIDPEKRHNFAISNRRGVLLGDYDYGSIMHYGLTHFSRNGLATVRALQDTNQTIGQRNLPSAGDIESIARLYASDLAIVMQLEQNSDKSEITVYLTNDHPQGAHDIVIDIETGRAALAESFIDDVHCMPVDNGAKCRLPVLAGGETRIARLSFDSFLDENNVGTHVRSKTPDRNVNNNSVGIAGEPVLARVQQDFLDPSTENVRAGLSGYPMLVGLLLLGISRGRRSRLVGTDYGLIRADNTRIQLPHLVAKLSITAVVRYAIRYNCVSICGQGRSGSRCGFSDSNFFCRGTGGQKLTTDRRLRSTFGHYQDHFQNMGIKRLAGMYQQMIGR